MKLTLVAGARPNFMKIAPLIRAIEARPLLDYRLVHTGQHYDRDMNEVFFEELGIPAPDTSLGCGGGSHATQTAAIMVAFEKELIDHRPDWVVVVGDVNSTLACSIVARKLQIPVAHVEAGLRSGDRSMPEEINRLVTDAITDRFFVTEPSGREHLLREGQPEDRVHYVGHVMIDNLFHQVAQLRAMDDDARAAFASEAVRRRMLGQHGRYGAVTMHRPANVDDPQALRAIVGALRDIARQLPLVFPVHPRTRANLARHGIELGADIVVLGPLPYMDFLNLWRDAALVLTDSGGLQEETTALGVRCVTMRDSTERPATVSDGTNLLAGTDPDAIRKAAAQALAAPASSRRPALWDGRAAERIAAVFEDLSAARPLRA